MLTEVEGGMVVTFIYYNNMYVILFNKTIHCQLKKFLKIQLNEGTYNIHGGRDISYPQTDTQVCCNSYKNPGKILC